MRYCSSGMSEVAVSVQRSAFWNRQAGKRLKQTSFHRKLRKIATQHSSNRITQDAVQTIIASGITSYDEMFRQVADTQVDGNLRWSIGHVLLHWQGNIGKDAAQAIIRMLKQPHTDYDFGVGMFLGQMASRQAVAPLVDVLLNHPDSQRRALAAYILGQMDNRLNQSAFKPLLQTINNELGDDMVRGYAVEALAYIENRKAVPASIKLLQNDSVRLRWEVIFALSILGDATTIPTLQHIVETDHRPSLDPDGKPLSEQAQGAIESIQDRMKWQQIERRDRFISYMRYLLLGMVVYFVGRGRWWR